MEISIRISTNYRPCLCSRFGNAKLFCIMNSYWPLFSEGSSTQFKTKLALIGFILWHLWESENQHSLSTVVKCQIFGRFIVNVQKTLCWRTILFSLPINITNNTNFYRLKNSFTDSILCNWAPNRTCHPGAWHMNDWLLVYLYA